MIPKPTEAEETARLRQALQEAERRLQAVVDVSGEPLGTLEFELQPDGELIFTRADDVAGRLITVAAPPFYGQQLLTVFTGMAGTDLPAALCETARHGHALPTRTFVPPGTRLARAFSMFAFQPAPGRVVIKLWESSGLPETQEIGRRNRELVSRIFSEGPVATALVREPEGTIVDVNAEWSRLTGYERHEVLGRTALDLGLWRHAADRDAVMGRLRQSGSVQNIEMRFRRREGQDVVFSLHASGVDVGGTRHVLVHLLDITARKQAELALQHLNAELESRVQQRTAELEQARDDAHRANRFKSDFLSGMSHELRTPLNAILGFGQLLQADPQQLLPPRERGFVKEIVRAGHHLLELINEVLDLARIEAGKMQISMEPVHVASLIDDCIALMRPVALEHDIELLAPPSETGDFYVNADRTRARQVLLNLLSNAIKFNREGGSVRLACVAEGDRLDIEVSDTGAGLGAEQQALLFKTFERLDADKVATPGTGIGLALSRSLMHLMGGEIGVRSQPGQGSTFWFRLQRASPMRPTGPPTLAVAPPATPAQAAAGAVPRHTVLYIEDNPANARLMDEVLGYVDGVRMIHASTPSLGLEVARTQRPDLILVDIQLPGMDGFEVLRRLRMADATRSIPTVAVSANAMSADVKAGLAAGFTHYLTKPLQVQTVLDVVGAMLGRRVP